MEYQPNTDASHGHSYPQDAEGLRRYCTDLVIRVAVLERGTAPNDK